MSKTGSNITDLVTRLHSSLQSIGADDHHAQLHASSHHSGGADELNHDNLAGFVAAEHLALPNTIANVLTNHTKAVHDALGIDADTWDGHQFADYLDQAVKQASNVIFGKITTQGGDGGRFDLKGLAGGHIYIQWFPQGGAAGRKAWMGYGSNGTEDFQIKNEVSGKQIKLYTTGAGFIDINENLKTPKLTIGSYYLNSLIANNKVPDSEKWNGKTLPTLVAEKVLYNDGTNLSWWTANLGWLSDLNLGSLQEGETLMYRVSTGKWVNGWGIDYDLPYTSYKIYTDFFAKGNNQNDPWVGNAVSGGTCISVAGTGKHPGIAQFRSTTSANSGYYFLTSVICMLIAGEEHSEFVFKTPGALTNVRARLGYQDSTGVNLGYDGVYLDINGTTLTGKTRNNNSGSTTSSSYTLSTNTWYRGKIAVNSDATQVTFWLYSESGTQLWTDSLTTNIPTASARMLGHGVIAYSVSTSIIALIDIDFMTALCARPIQR